METATYIVEIVFTTTDGELPTKEEATQLIADQMAGELDERTGLFYASVQVLDVKAE